MDLVSNLGLGFDVALTSQNLLYALFGCALGTLIGVLPGIGSLATISMLLPATYGMPPVTALIMLAGIYYGAQYGGSTTAILANLPGEASSVITTVDGYKMSQQGLAGPALSAAGIGSFIAGCIGILLIAGFAKPLTEVALAFGPAEYFALILFGLLGSLALTAGSLINAAGSVIIGILLGLIGTDINTGVIRFNLSIPELTDGIGFVAVAMGVFGYADVIQNLGNASYQDKTFTSRIFKLFPSKDNWQAMMPAIIRGSGIGSILGLLPGGGALLSSFASYTVEKKVKLKEGEQPLGTGNIRGVAGPESANNAGAQTSFIPMLTLGIPSNAVMALMIGAMTIQGIQPGPQVIASNPELFWGLIASMWIGNLMLLILNLPLIGIWVKLLTVPYKWLFPSIVLFCAVGVYSTNNNNFDIWMVALFGLLGYIFVKLRCEPTLLLLGFILGPAMEEHLRRALLLSQGDWYVFVNHPISLTMLVLSVVVLFSVLLPLIKQIRSKLKEN